MKKRSCDDAVAKIYPYLDGEISVVRRIFVRYHLRRCSGCVDAFTFEERLQIVVRQSCQEQMPEALSEKLRALIRDEPA